LTLTLLACRNLSGDYSTDFPDQPPNYYNFTDESYSIDQVFTVQATKVKVLNYNESVEIVFQGTNVIKGSVLVSKNFGERLPNNL
jgi:laccase